MCVQLQGHDPAGPEPVSHRPAVGSISREMGHRGTVQGIQTADGGWGLSWAKRAGSETGVVCMLHPHGHDPAVRQPRRGSFERASAERRQVADANENVKHGLAAVAANIENLLLQQASALRETVARIVGEIVRCRQRLRPGRPCERRSRKPIGKWHRGRGTRATAGR